RERGGLGGAGLVRLGDGRARRGEVGRREPGAGAAGGQEEHAHEDRSGEAKSDRFHGSTSRWWRDVRGFGAGARRARPPKRTSKIGAVSSLYGERLPRCRALRSALTRPKPARAAPPRRGGGRRRSG